MIEIEGKDISELSDSDLRSLIGLLCEAELRANDLPTAGVTWGGHQNAKDGGIDVRLELTTVIHNDSFIPRKVTVFQVKKPDMPRSAILNEMCPGGELREAIKDLIEVKGAYIIVSSQGSTADSTLKNRKEAMQEALSQYPDASEIKVDFYDRERIAGWVRNHPSLVLWVRDKIGRPIQGWRSYGNWTGSPNGPKNEYKLDDHIRLQDNTNPRSGGFSAIEGINELRTRLKLPGSSVRLVGLSGVGKTRLLQALFDERIGESPLNQSRVFYTDISDSPNPEPRNFAERLIAMRIPSILAVDNCPPELHRRLTSVCSASGSLVSLVTVEYDVREDQPEETDVFRLEPASNEIIEKIILDRFDYINQVDARSIAEFSGGNARIAIALGNTIRRGESVSDLKDNQLFNRLFQQRNEPNNSLRRTAEACSLVYSFDSRTQEGANIELKLLSSLANLSIREVYENIVELKRRDLVQQRSVWRAVLPHAIANRLAKEALERIPIDIIMDTFEKGGSERLLKSFSRRLSYLHECGASVQVSERWLSEGGLLGDISHLNELGISLLENIAPINPQVTLSAIERVSMRESAETFFSRENDHFSRFTRLLRSLAYDKDLFERSAELLCQFALSESPDENYDSIRSLLRSLFYIYLSGTHATPEQRIKIIKKLVESDHEDQVDLGISLLDASLETWHFSSSYSFEFGARSRDYGYSPENKKEIQDWYKLFIQFTVSKAISRDSVSLKAKSLLSDKFRGLWTKAGMYNELEEATKQILDNGTWKEGWLAVKTTKRYDSEHMTQEVISRLKNLEVILRPTTLTEKARLYALTSHQNAFDLVETVEYEDEKLEAAFQQAENITRSLGKEVVQNEDIFYDLLPDLLSCNGARLFSFGQGLAEGSDDLEKVWRDLKQQLSVLQASAARNFQVVRGFLNAVSNINKDLYQRFLDEAVFDQVFAEVYPMLQTSSEINNSDVERLKKSLEYGSASIWQYSNLAYGRIHETIEDDDLCELLRLISQKPEGNVVAIEILHMRLHGFDKGKLSDIIVSTAQKLLAEFKFDQNYRNMDHLDYVIAEIIKACLGGESAKESAVQICNNLKRVLSSYSIYRDSDHVLHALAKMQPNVFLDIFLAGDDDEVIDRFENLVIHGVRTSSNPISQINENFIIQWCEVDPKTRYPKAATVITPFKKGDDKSLEWTELALNLLDYSPDPILILNEFKSSFRPMSWSGSRADIMQNRLGLIYKLEKHSNPIVAEWASKEKRTFQEEIRSERKWESELNEKQNERFE
ncbi:hypothetical protein GCM10011391_13590 [Pullulanibacillus camelliae]|uniref:Uncharacterized protein n=1 Tax=Pullulanibacillus camelliae TaxID=1707096 RepID=A0A8J2YGI0_9BACL|nr:hypothetical protein [Pullulanibacillus camelliae]GGE36067.1 hypothetical protein GCM10011391_13590 [Pullulanibacillus camelliae]